MDNENVSKEDKKKKLIGQILKFGFVGGTSFVIDFVITLMYHQTLDLQLVHYLLRLNHTSLRTGLMYPLLNLTIGHL